jgi:non-specific serine/threonine protein kinase
MYKELIVVVLPDQNIELEWQDTEEAINKDQELLQNELYNRFRKDFNSFLLFLGFCGQSVTLSAGLDFFRKFTGLYVNKITRVPNLEVLRAGANIPLIKEEIDDFVQRFPFTVGAEYVNAPFLESIWLKLDTIFKSKINAYKGAVEDFIKTFSTDVHLIGRIYFHLVESKKEDLPFAFLATYSNISSTKFILSL